MPIITSDNYLSYGYFTLGLRHPFTVEAVREQAEIISEIRYEKSQRPKRPKELSGAEFIAFCHQYNARKQP